MAREFSKSFYDSPAWRRVRKCFIANRITIDGGLCQMCKIEQGYIVDHVIELTADNINDTDITFHWHNLQYLCLSCHNTKTFKKNDRYRFDEDGEMIWLDDGSPP